MINKIYVVVNNDKSINTSTRLSKAMQYKGYGVHVYEVLLREDIELDCPMRIDNKVVAVKLNPEYTATVCGDQVNVGCQTFSKEKVRELYQACFPQE